MRDQPGGTDAGGRRRVGSALGAWRAVMSRFGELVILRRVGPGQNWGAIEIGKMG